MKKGDYVVTEYQGGYSSLKPNYGGFVGYRMAPHEIGMSTDARTANVLQEVSKKLNMGVNVIELSQVSPQVFESIPQGHLKEVNRLAKLTGVDVTLHAPVVEPTGLSQQGYEETMRQSAEQQMKLAIERAHELNPDKNSPVTFHSTAQIPGTQYKPTKDGKTEQLLIAVDRETGKMAPLKEELRFYPETDLQGKTYTPSDNLKVLNESEWSNRLNQVFFNQERVHELIEKNALQTYEMLEDFNNKKYTPENLPPEKQPIWNSYVTSQNYLTDLRAQVNSLFNKAYQFGDEKQKEYLKDISKDFKEQLDSDPSQYNQSQALQQLVNELQAVPPKMYVPIEEFATEKAAETFSNVALHSYKEFKDKAPIVSIENPPYGGALSGGEELKNLVDKTREMFVEKATKEGMSKSEAKKQADKIIGVTWDVGHINMMRKAGFDKKEIIKESEKIAPMVKHVHLSDNFGLEHTELPMGMGNVPIKEIMEKLGKEGHDAKKVVEAINWWQHFSPGGMQNPPFAATLEAFGSPIYSDSVGPYWNQSIGFQQGYFGGYGMMLPQTNYETFGAGFIQLPTELGGARPGAGGSRMSGRPME